MIKWDNIVKEWQDISIENYKFIIERSEKRFDDILSESESITNKSIKLLSAVILSITFFTSLDLYCFCWLCFLFLIYVIDIILLVKLVFPKYIVFKGSEPKEIFHTGIENDSSGMPFTDKEKIVVVYYSEVCRLQDGITKNEKNNSERHAIYMGAIILSSVILISDVITYVICHHPLLMSHHWFQ